jgi:hypothetical protein
MRALWTLAAAAALCVAVSGASAGTIHEIDYAGWDVTVTDSQNVKTDLSDFGYWTGPNILNCLRGDAKVEIPFRLIKSLSVGAYLPVKGWSPATVVTRKGKSFQVQIERFEGQRYLSGKTDFGSMRIQLMHAARIDFHRLSHTESGSS